MSSFLKYFLFLLVAPFTLVNGKEAEIQEPVVILGGGVGSLTSAIYLGRAGLSPLVIEGPIPGGLLTQSHTVQNWPGVMEIDGTQLTEKMKEQAKSNGARFLQDEVIGVDFSQRPFVIFTRSLDGTQSKRRIHAGACIIAMGSKPNFLAIPGEKDYWGKGVTNCAICDGSLYKGKTVGVVGGGDAAVLEALYLSNIAKEVHLFVRGSSLKAIEEKRVEVLKSKPNVKFYYHSTVQEVKGNQEHVTGILLQKEGKAEFVSLDALFLAIGSTPNTTVFKNTLQLDSKGYIVLQKDQQTSLEGVYAIGDIVDPFYKQAISASGDGAKAALQAQQYLSDRANKLVVKNEIVKGEKIAVKNQVIEISSMEEWNREISSSSTPILVDFYASWCGPCKRVSPLIDSASQRLQGKVKFLKVNVDQFPKLSETYGIKAMPTVIFLNASGKEIERKVGLDTIEAFLKDLQ